MIENFDKEEFLARLDLRIFTIANMLGYHEKWVASMFSGLGVKDSQVKSLQDNIDKAIKDFTNHISEHDQKIKDFFKELEEELKGE